MRPHVWNLRSKRCFRAIESCFRAGKERKGFRLVHFSVQGNHLHMLVEAPDASSLSRGMQGLAIRIARALNRVMQQRGTVFGDRYHARILRSPREVANALAYVLGNHRHHARAWGERFSDSFRDPYSSAAYLEVELTPEAGSPPVASPGTWLLRIGWRRARRGPEPPG